MSKKCLRRKLVRGGRGAVSLFLAVLLTPFLTVAVLMVEVQKYNSSVSIMDEAMGVSSTSVLADYDNFLLNRWGLTAIDQGVDVPSEYSRVLGVNAKALGNSITLNSVTASGVEDLNLANSDVLYNQIQEFSKLNAPVTLAEETLNLSDLIGSLEKINNVNLIADLVKDLSNTANSMISFDGKAQNLKKASNALDSRSSNLWSKFSTFHDAANGLIDACIALDDAKSDASQSQQALETARQAVTTYETEVNEYQAQIDEREKKKESLDVESTKYKELESKIEELKKKIKEVKKAHRDDYQHVESCKRDRQAADQKVTEREGAISGQRDSARSAQREYSSSLGAAQRELDTYLDKVKGCTDLLKTATSSAGEPSVSLVTKPGFDEKAQKQGESISDIAHNDAVNISNKAMNAGTQAYLKDWNKQFASDWEARVSSCKDSLSSVKTSVDAFPVDSATSSTAKVTDGSYYLDLSSLGYITADKVDEYLENQKEETFGSDSSLGTFIKGMSAMMNLMFSIKLFYDGDLSASIDTGYYESAIGGLPGIGMDKGGLLDVVNDVSNAIGSASDFGKSVVNWDFLKAWTAVGKFADSCSSFVADVTCFVVQVGQNVIDLFTNYERLYYSTYSTYNTTCRTKKTSVMSGGKPELADKEYTGPEAIKNIQGLVETLKSFMNNTGEDKAFCGAELEYILFGSSSEIANQLYTFSGIYLIRFLVGLPAIFLNSEVQAMADAATVVAPVVFLVIALLEPLVDTILLVNGENIDLLKKTIYLTPSGVVDLVEALTKIGVTDVEDGLKECVLSAFPEKGSPSDDSTGKLSKAWSDYTGGLLSLNYRDYCFMLMLLTVGKDAQMARLANLIQMEGTLHYQNSQAPFTFNLKKSYSFVQAEADISVKQLLPSLTDSKWFTIKRTQYRGY